MTSNHFPSVRQVTVGVKRADSDGPALRWAAAEAVSRRSPLRVVHAYEWRPGPVWPARLRSMPEGLPREARQAGAEQLAAAVRECRAAQPGLAITEELIEGSATEVLRYESKTAELLVLGTADSRRIAVIGTTLQSVIEWASCPVVVVPSAGTFGRPARVVVGLDLKHNGDASIAFGFEQAQRNRATLEAVTCWQPDLLDAESLLEPVVAEDKAAVEQQLCEELLPWQRKYPEVHVLATVSERRPVVGLAERVTAADLLVLGRHGNHPLRAALGSVHLAELRRACCPVALVPAEQPC